MIKNHHSGALIAFPMMMNLINIAFKPLKMEIKVKLSSLTTIIVHFGDDNSYVQLYRNTIATIFFGKWQEMWKLNGNKKTFSCII